MGAAQKANAVRLANILVTGAAGQLGSAVTDLLGKDEVYALDSAALDVTDRREVRAAIETLRPTAVINAAAYTAVDDCETNEQVAMRVNAFAVRNLVEACEAVDAFLCHVSTDYVFDGTKSSPYHEWDTPNPQSIYGLSKRGGELEVLSSHAVVRTAWLYGDVGHNIVRTVLQRAIQGQPMKFVTDQVGNPTYASDLAEALVFVARNRIPGTLHVTNEGSASWYEFAKEILTQAGLDTSLVSPILTADLEPQRPAPRPANSRLAGIATRAAGIGMLPVYQDALKRFMNTAETA